MSLPRTSPVVLPYKDLLTGETGWQLGLPGVPLPSGGRPAPNVLIIKENGETVLHESPVFMPPTKRLDPGETGRPPTPQWGWTTVQVGGGYRLHRVHAPIAGPNAKPLVRQLMKKRMLYTNDVLEPSGEFFPEYLDDRPQVFFCTPSGYEFLRDHAARDGHIFERIELDLDTDLALSEKLQGEGEYFDAFCETSLGAGEARIAQVYYRRDRVIAIRPLEFATRHGLWTSHIVSMAMAAM